jgi:beta-aspartyl-peptidase (threonine type)
MKKIIVSIIILSMIFSCRQKENIQAENKREQTFPFALVIHGGAGYIENLPPEIEKAYRDKLNEALQTGYQILEQGGSALQAVQKTINVMENSSLFNAGKGCVLNSLGKPEMDASIMDGKTLNCGAVAGVSHIKNPINAALLVKDSTRHVLLSGKGAEMFCQKYGIIMEDESYFITKKRLEQLKRIQAKEKQKTAYLPQEFNGIRKYGTVGCVALDKKGNIAAGTSTGGLMNKQFGRIGDSPIIGAGTYADNQTCGISCTGTGEYFIRTAAAHSVSDIIKYKNYNLQDAQKQVISQIEQLGGDGGMIGIDNKGNIAWFFNTKGMFRAYKKSGEKAVIKMYKK